MAWWASPISTGALTVQLPPPTELATVRYVVYRKAQLHDLAYEPVPNCVAELLELGNFMSNAIQEIATEDVESGRNQYRPPFSMVGHRHYPCWLEDHPINEYIRRMFQEWA